MGLETETLKAIGLLLSGTGAAATALNMPKSPSAPQKSKTPDAGMSAEERRNKLLAQLAAGAARNNPSGGLAGNPNVGSVKLGA